MYHTLANKIHSQLHLKPTNTIKQSTTVLSHTPLPTIDHTKTIIHKIQQCNITHNNIKSLTDTKRKYLLELIQIFNQNIIPEDYTPFIIQMVSINLFRSLPDPLYKDFNPESDEPNIEPFWPYLQLVYEILQQFIQTSDIEILQKHITKEFIINLMNLFDSQNSREREYLKQIIHIVYRRCDLFRPFIRQTMNNILYYSIYNNKQHNGISEILQIYSAIISGYVLPLKQEHLSLLKTILIPMHKVSFLSDCHRQLSYCMMQFIQKDPLLVNIIINGLLKYWPVLSTQKQLLFLNELQQILTFTDIKQVQKVMIPLFKKIATLICSNHAIIAENALLLWNDPIIFKCITQYKKEIIPILYPALQENYRKHWNANVSLYTLKLTVLINEMDDQLFQNASAKYLQNEQQKILKKQTRKSKWKFIHQMAQKNKCLCDKQMNENKVHDCDIPNWNRSK